MKLKEIRELKGITQHTISKHLGVASPTYTFWENEVESIPLKRLNDICNFLDVSFDYIFGFSNTYKHEKYRKDINIKKSSERLKKIRKEHGHTQDYLGNKFSLDRSLISKYEKGNTLISTTFLFEYAKLYHISCDYLLGKIDKKEEIKALIIN